MNKSAELRSYPVCGVEFGIDNIVEVCADLPDVVRCDRTSATGARYYFYAPLTGIEIAREIIAECWRRWPNVYDKPGSLSDASPAKS